MSRTARMPYVMNRSRTENARRVVTVTSMCLLLGCISTPKPVPTTQVSVSSLPVDGAIAIGAINELESTPVVQVRDFWGQRTVSVLGFYDENETYGLRAEVRRDGELTSPRRRNDHRLYINSFVVYANGGFRRASVGTRNYPLVTGYQFDANACLKKPHCSPYRSITLGIPDSVLRNSRDGMVVLFERETPTQWTIAFSGEMISAYLNAVDSVVATQRAN